MRVEIVIVMALCWVASAYFAHRASEAHRAWLRALDNRLRRIEGLPPINWGVVDSEREK